MKKILLISLLFLASCAAKVTNEGRMVREINADWANKCEFLGMIEAEEGMGWDFPDNDRGALNKIRNKVAAMGGNAYVITNISSGATTRVQADAYRIK